MTSNVRTRVRKWILCGLAGIGMGVGLAQALPQERCEQTCYLFYFWTFCTPWVCEGP